MTDNIKIFIWKWFLAIAIGFTAIAIGIVGFVIKFIEMGFFFTLFGIAILFYYIFFVPHSFLFCSDNIMIIYIFKRKTVKYIHIKSCSKEESGIRNYPWGKYYHVIVDKPFWQEFKIPSTKKIDSNINVVVSNIKPRWSSNP